VDFGMRICTDRIKKCAFIRPIRLILAPEIFEQSANRSHKLRRTYCHSIDRIINLILQNPILWLRLYYGNKGSGKPKKNWEDDRFPPGLRFQRH
jgi:hypothetical protein